MTLNKKESAIWKTLFILTAIMGLCFIFAVAIYSGKITVGCEDHDKDERHIKPLSRTGHIQDGEPVFISSGLNWNYPAKN